MSNLYRARLLRDAALREVLELDLYLEWEGHSWESCCEEIATCGDRCADSARTLLSAIYRTLLRYGVPGREVASHEMVRRARELIRRSYEVACIERQLAPAQTCPENAQIGDLPDLFRHSNVETPLAA